MMDCIDIIALHLSTHAISNASHINSRMISYKDVALLYMESPMSYSLYPDSNNNMCCALHTILLSTAVEAG